MIFIRKTGLFLYLFVHLVAYSTTQANNIFRNNFSSFTQQNMFFFLHDKHDLTLIYNCLITNYSSKQNFIIETCSNFQFLLFTPLENAQLETYICICDYVNRKDVDMMRHEILLGMK